MKASDFRELSDVELLNGYRQTHDQDYFLEVFNRYSGKIRSGCLKFFRGDRALAEDAAQETFRKALEKLDSCAAENLGGWLYMIAKHCCIDVHRKRWLTTDDDLPNPVSSRTAGATALVEQERAIQIAELKERINQLQEKQRISLKLYLDGYSYKEISQMTHYREMEVKSAIQASKENLKKWYSGDK